MDKTVNTPSQQASKRPIFYALKGATPDEKLFSNLACEQKSLATPVLLQIALRMNILIKYEIVHYPNIYLRTVAIHCI